MHAVNPLSVPGLSVFDACARRAAALHAEDKSYLILVVILTSDRGLERAWQVDGDLDADGDEEPLDDDWGLDEEHV